MKFLSLTLFLMGTVSFGSVHTKPKLPCDFALSLVDHKLEELEKATKDIGTEASMNYDTFYRQGTRFTAETFFGKTKFQSAERLLAIDLNYDGYRVKPYRFWNLKKRPHIDILVKDKAEGAKLIKALGPLVAHRKKSVKGVDIFPISGQKKFAEKEISMGSFKFDKSLSEDPSMGYILIEKGHRNKRMLLRLYPGEYMRSILKILGVVS